MDSFSKCVFVRAGKHTSVHDMHPHSNGKGSDVILGPHHKGGLYYIDIPVDGAKIHNQCHTDCAFFTFTCRPNHNIFYLRTDGRRKSQVLGSLEPRIPLSQLHD